MRKETRRSRWPKAALLLWVLLGLVTVAASVAEPSDGVVALDLGDQELSFVDFSLAEVQVFLCPEASPLTTPPELRRTIIWDPNGDGKRHTLLAAMVVFEDQDDGQEVGAGLEPLQFCAASRDPIVLPCGEFRMTAKLAPGTVQPQTEIDFYLDAAASGGIFSGSLDLELELRFENADLSRVASVEHRLPLQLHGPWRFAAEGGGESVARDLDCDGAVEDYWPASNIELGATPEDEAPPGFCSAGEAGAGWLCWQAPI